MGARSYTRTTYHLDDFELPFGPVADYLNYFIKIVGKRAVVGYLVHDEDAGCCDPMENSGSGQLLTSERFGDTESQALSALGLEAFGSYHHDIVRNVEVEGVDTLAIELLYGRVFNERFDRFLEFCKKQYEPDTDEEVHSERVFAEHCFDTQLDFSPWGTAIPSFLEDLYQECLTDAWDTLYAQGKIGAELAVPVRYCDNNHGPGTASAYPTDLGNANAVWVPCSDAIENIKAQCWPEGVKIEWKGACGSETDPLHAVVTYNGARVFDSPKWSEAQKYVDDHYTSPAYKDLHKAAVKYCESVLDEYVKWINGEVYGVIVVTYEDVSEDGSDEQVWQQLGDEDACWGFIGSDYAEESLKEEFDKVVESIENGSAHD